MAEQSPPKKKAPSDFDIILFIIILCFSCGFLLAVVAFGLRTPQQAARDFDQNKQMLIAAKILTHTNRFVILEEDGTLTPARFDHDKNMLVAVDEGQRAPLATDEEVGLISKMRIRPLLTNDKGALFTLKEKNVELSKYLTEHKKSGYAKLPLKLLYAILPNSEEAANLSDDEIVKDIAKADLFVVPVSGFGLWAPIYGYLAVGHNGDKVVGTTWYEMAETPGLGANIAEARWQEEFYGKVIFQESAEGKKDLATATMGLIVVKGRVQDVLGNSPRAKSAVDGISGATLTGDGVTAAYQNSLAPYRAFFMKVNEGGSKEKTKT